MANADFSREQHQTPGGFDSGSYREAKRPDTEAVRLTPLQQKLAGLEKALDSQLAGTKEHDTLVCAVTAQGRLRAGETPQLTRQDSSAVGVQLTISRPVQRAAGLLNFSKN